ncbi:glycosyltransferase [Herbiconiux sp. P15]|uniref:glycosyltransferase n=1 Tax=Herbiconiux liukaitaii TaxID=3342799 RepID=UPI0035B7EAFD
MDLVDAGLRVVVVAGDSAQDVASTLASLEPHVHGGASAVEVIQVDDPVTALNTVAEGLLPGEDLLVLRAGAVVDGETLPSLLSVLHAAERHGAVLPRTDEPGPGVMPRTTRSHEPAPPERARAVFDRISPELPEWSVSASASDLALLVRHDLIRRYGLFDDSFTSVQGAAADLIVRLARVGYSTVVAHRAFVAGPADSRPLGAVEADETLLRARYPQLDALERDFAALEVDAVDHFSEILVPQPGARKSILIDVDHLTQQYDGTARNAVSFLAALADSGIRERYDVFVQASPRTAEFFDLTRYGFPIVSSDDASMVYDLALSLSPLTHSDAILTLNRKAARWVLLHLDVIALRSLHLRSASWARRRVVQDSFAFADRIVSISRASIDDATQYFRGLSLEPARTTVVPQGATVAPFPTGEQDIGWKDVQGPVRDVVKRGDYLLIMGNWYPHKQVASTLEALRSSPHQIIALGLSSEDHLESDRIHGLPTGRLSDALLNRLIRDAAVVVYPSAYEGFGLPLVEGIAAGKRVVAFRSDAVAETVDTLDLGEYVDFFESFDEVERVVELSLERDRPPASVRAGIRSSDPFNSEIIDVVLDEVEREVDMDRLRARWNHFIAVAEYLGDAADARAQVRAQRDELARVHELVRVNDELLRTQVELSRRTSELDALLERIRARRSYRFTERLVTLPPVRAVIGRFRGSRG